MCHFCNLLGYCYIRDLRGIVSSESFDEPFNGKNIFPLCLVNGTLFPNQLVGLGDGRERIRDRLKVDLISLTIIPGAHPESECCDGYCLFTGLD